MAQWVRKAIAAKLEDLSWIPMAYIVEKKVGCPLTFACTQWYTLTHGRGQADREYEMNSSHRMNGFIPLCLVQNLFLLHPPITSFSLWDGASHIDSPPPQHTSLFT